ncbi:hypothetical protein ACR9JM_00065 [Helicobacter pylori]
MTFNMTFNMKNYLSVLAKNFDLFNICYCENKSPRMQLFINLMNKQIESYFHKRIINNGLPFGIIIVIDIDIDDKTKRNHVWHHPFTIEPYLILDNLKSFFIFQNDWHGYSKIPQEKRIAKIQEQVNEEIKINPSFCDHRVSSEQNRKVNKIAEDLKSGKIIGEKIIANAFDLNASYCFITPEDLKNLKERLFIQQDIDITHVINQKKGEAFDHILINDIKYNLLDNTFHFIFDIVNFLDEKLEFIIEVPREALDLENVDRLIENTLSLSPYDNILSENSLICHLNQGSYIIDLHLIDD